MQIFDNDILCLTEVHGLMHKPKDLTKEQFSLLCSFINAGPKDVIFCKKTFTAAIHCGIATSNGDVRRMIKGNALSVGPRKVTDFDDELNPEEFFKTGFEDVLWTTIRNGKKKSEIVIIQKDEETYPEDPWFGLEYDIWKDDPYVYHMILQNLKK